MYWSPRNSLGSPIQQTQPMSSTSHSQLNDLSKKSLNPSFLDFKTSQSLKRQNSRVNELLGKKQSRSNFATTPNRRASAPLIGRRDGSSSKNLTQERSSINLRFLQRIQNKENTTTNTSDSDSEDDVFDVNYSLYQEQNNVSEYLLNSLKNENFDMYSKKCLDKMKWERQKHIKKTRTKQNEAMLRNQYIKKQLVNVQLMNQRKEMERLERGLQTGEYEAQGKAQLAFSDLVPLSFADAIHEHRARTGEYVDSTADKWKNRRALKSTLVHSKHARRTFERQFGEQLELENRSMKKDEYGSVDVRAETEKLLARTRMLLDEMEG
uniref:Uncharacterized protein n=1 Tax=Percolomonas cosmopolitus TaxID=63605 RepID=A0A7S1PI50_9EUKA|mmetsp:Transcript_6029/g.22801  ORF Transcript_6029/g.22801 Transcript_6029/m.22801 type:complete len:323 (+) Transcript_6029:1326-2294(+)